MWHPASPGAPASRTNPADAATACASPPRLALAGLALCMLMPSMATSIANVGLPTLAGAFGAPFQDVQWIVLSYLLATTALIVSAGRLGDLLGRRRLLVAGIALFAVASLACGLAPTLALLIAARALQGVGAAIMMALAMALVGEIVPKERTGSAMGLLGAMSAIGTTLGPAVGGLLIDSVGWPAIFLINIPVAAAGLALILQIAPPAHQSGQTVARFDSLGTVLLIATLAAYALSMPAGRGAFGPLNGLLLIASAVGLAAFLWVQTRVQAPLIRLAMFRNPALNAGLATSALVSTVMMTTLVVGPFYLSRAAGLGAAWVGLAMAAGPLVAAFCGVPAGRIVDRFGAGPAVAVGLVGMTAGLLVLALCLARFGPAAYLGATITITASYALFQAANNTAVMTTADPGQRGVVGGLLSLSRNLGLVTGASAMGAVFAFASAANDITRAPALAVTGGAQITFAVAAGLTLLALAVASVEQLGRRLHGDRHVAT